MGIKQAAGKLIRSLSGETVMVRSLNNSLLPRLRRVASSLGTGAHVLDIGAKNALYRGIFSHCNFQTVDIDPKHNPDIVADVHELDRIVSPQSVDVVICTEVLEHIADPSLAITKIYGALKPGGTLVASTPFLVPYHPDPRDYWRMTNEGWAELTRQFSRSEIVWHGNQPLSVWYLAGMGYGMPLRLFDGIAFAIFRRLRGNGLYLGVLCEAQR